MTTWREHNFKPERSYIVLKTFRTTFSIFEEGETVVYKHAIYSWYDCATIFVFEDANKETCSLFLRDDEPDVTAELFRLVE